MEYHRLTVLLRVYGSCFDGMSQQIFFVRDGHNWYKLVATQHQKKGQGQETQMIAPSVFNPVDVAEQPQPSTAAQHKYLAQRAKTEDLSSARALRCSHVGSRNVWHVLPGHGWPWRALWAWHERSTCRQACTSSRKAYN
eukprot:753706-Amphidinium_carterae.1